jgi:electron transport complex protein RnfB
LSTLNQQIDALLPQTQCQRCGYPRCADYADAIATGEANINRCPPGSEYTRTALAHLLHLEAIELDPECGSEAPRLLFYVDEKHCIGCTLCIQACPVDAIVGSAKKMHTIIANECTGCELCVPACPVDCIDSKTHQMANTAPSGKWPGISNVEANRARRRINSRLQRLQRIAKVEGDKRKIREASNIRDEIAAAVERVKQKQHQR